MSERKSSLGKWIVLFVLLFMIVAGIAVITAAVIMTAGEGVDEGSILKVKLSGEIPDDKPPMAFLGHKKVTFPEIIMAVKAAADSPKVDGILLDIHNPVMGFAHIEELRDTVKRFKESGKPVYAYFESTGNGGYYLASAADEIYMPPSGSVYLVGLHMEVPFFRGFLDKIGVTPHLMHYGEYKSASDIFMKEDMPEPMREVENAILDGLYEHMVTGIAEGRGLSNEKVEELIDNGPYNSKRVVQIGLIDELKYKDELIDYLEGKHEQEELKTVSARQVNDEADMYEKGEYKIAVIIATGTIVSGKGRESPFGEANIGSDTFTDILKNIREDDSIDGVLFRVDSPGGSAVASDLIWREEKITREKKPIVVSMGDVAASGGYYIAVGADAIVAEPSTITGSIGVVTGKFSTRGLYDWLEINKVSLKRGENADLFSTYQGWVGDQEEKMRQDMMHIYWQFVDRVAEGRGMNPEEVNQLARGRVWTGSQALDRGLIDKLGGVEEALALLKEKANIPADADIKIVKYPKSKSFFEMAFDVYSPRRVTIEDILKNPEILNPFGQERYLALAPEFTVK